MSEFDPKTVSQEGRAYGASKAWYSNKPTPSAARTPPRERVVTPIENETPHIRAKVISKISPNKPKKTNIKSNILEYEKFKNKKLFVFNYIIDLLYGPVKHDFERIIKDGYVEGELSKIEDRLAKIGVPEDMARMVAGFMVDENLITTCMTVWNTIPTYKQAKQQAISDNPAEHFDKYWRPFGKIGMLYQHIITRYDPSLITDLSGYLKRASDIDKAEYLIPTKSDYNTKLATYLDSSFGQRLTKLSRTLSNRKAKGIDTKVGTSTLEFF